MLSFLLLFPIAGALFIALFPNLEGKVRTTTTIITSILLVVSLWLLTQLDLSNTNYQFTEYVSWAEAIGLNYSLGVDGFSLSLVVLNSFITLIALYSDSKEVKRPRLYYSLILLSNAGITGALIAKNLLLFIFFYEIELIPFYLLISIWGGEKRGYAGIKFLLYSAISGLLVLAAFLGVVFLTGSGNFDFDMLNTDSLSLKVKLILLTLIVVGFAIKTPLVPLHTWQPDAYVESSPAVAILLGGVLSKLGTYGLIRFGLQLFPTAWDYVSSGLAIVGTVSVIYGALTAIAQKDIKRMVAYSSIGHMGYIIVATASGTQLSELGAIAQMISHSLILALLFHLVGIVERKAGTRDLDTLNGLMNPVRGLPLTSALLILAGMASAGIPGLVGFIAEFIVFQGSFSRFPIPTLLCIISSGLTAVYFVILLNRTCFGRLDNKLAYYPKVLLSEKIPALVLTALIVILGIQPYWLVHWIEPTSKAIVSSLPTHIEVAVNKE